MVLAGCTECAGATESLGFAQYVMKVCVVGSLGTFVGSQATTTICLCRLGWHFAEKS